MIKFTIRTTSVFRKNLKLMKKRGYDLSLLQAAVSILASGEGLPSKYSDHALKGTFRQYRECHITPDWLLVYEIREQELVLVLSRTGTHSDIFSL